ncbi:MAG: ATP-dependent helicase, partial [Candidatus Gastranaerophilales bacterium]|nr:ATP-dependent helicase [Candidatus Gastranaerophilales bacterium]
MLQLIKGHAGSGKTQKLLEDVYSLLNIDTASSYQILILTLTPSEKLELTKLNQNKEESKHLNIWSVDDLLNYILKKSPSHFENQTLSDSLAINIIGSICKSEFIQNTALNNLTKSNSFFRELYNLFGLFKNNEISYEDLTGVIDETEITDTDKIRLRIIASVFKRYNEILKCFNYVDYRDAVLYAIKALEENEILLHTVKSKFSHIFIDGFEDITYLQFKLIKLIADPDNLYIYGDEYSRIQEFRGAWRDSLILNSLKEHFDNIEITNLDASQRNPEIIQRALYLVKKYNSEESNCEFRESESINYIQFEDVQAEISHIAEEISDKVKNKNCSFSDFAILIRDFESKQKFIDFFKTYGIPINSELYNEEYQNFRLKLTRYLSICNICEKLGIKEFSKQGFSNIRLNSKAELEIQFEELNLYIENILSDTLEDHYLKDRFITIQEEYNKPSLINVIYENVGILKEEDKEKILAEFSDLSDIYKLYRENKFVELTVFIARKQKEILNNPEFNAILGKLLSKINAMTDLYSTVIKDRPDFNTLNELINLSVEEQSAIKDSVNLLTFFKTAGLEFKYVYIPCLTENNFPKKAKSTYFISPDANEKVSASLKQINSNFRNLIELDEESIEEEARLFYLGMTRAKDKLLISTHKYEDKKQVQPSIFFQVLVDVDNANYKEAETKQSETTDNYDLNQHPSEEIIKSKVIAENEVLKLNPSAIGTFLKCPRLYYYENLLNLKKKSNFAANYGNIVHYIMEVFNTTCLDKYSKESLLNLADILFDAKNNSGIAIKVGFKEKNLELIIATDDLNLAEMKENFSDAVDNLELNNFFNEVPEKIITEQGFAFQLDDLPNVLFDGRIDALYKYNDIYCVFDYKTGKDKKKKLSYYLSDYGLNFQGDYRQYAGVFSEKLINEYEYQIPLYYLACQNAPELEAFKGKVEALGLKYIRPTSKDDGYKEDLIASSEIEEKKEKLVQNLK